MSATQTFGQPANENTDSFKKGKELQDRGRELIKNPKEAVDLLNEIGTVESEIADMDRKLDEFESALNEARIKGENGRKSGFEFVQEMENALSTLARENRLTFLGSLALSSKWFLSGLEPPESLASTNDEIGQFMKSEYSLDSRFVKGILDFRLNQMTPEGKSVPKILYETIVSTLPSLPSPTKYEFVRMAVGMPDEQFADLGCSLLFEHNETVRRAAMDGLSDRLESGLLTSGILAKLTLIRSWLNNSETIRQLDQLVRDSMKKGFEITESKTVFKHRSAFSSAVDGSGSQGIIVSIKTRNSHKLVIMLLKQGFGVKEAYVVPCRSKNQQVEFIEQWKIGMRDVETYEVPMEYARKAVALALHQGAQSKVVPSPGLADCLEFLGLPDIRPEGGSMSEILAEIDPEGKITGLDDGKLAELVDESGFWPEQFNFINEWFETNDSSDDILASDDSVEGKWKRLYEFFNSRREFWSSCIVRMAMLLNSVKKVCSDEFVAVAAALDRDWDLEKIPVFDIMISQTIESWQYEKGVPVNGMEPNPAAKAANGTLRISSNDLEFRDSEIGRSELKKRLAPANLKLEWLDGFFAGACTAPANIRMVRCFADALERLHIDFPSMEELNETLSLINKNYNYIVSKLRKGKAQEILPSEDSDLSVWATGYLSNWDDYPESWPPKLLGQAGAEMRAGLELAANNEAEPAEFRKTVTEWLEIRSSRNWS